MFARSLAAEPKEDPCSTAIENWNYDLNLRARSLSIT